LLQHKHYTTITLALVKISECLFLLKETIRYKDFKKTLKKLQWIPFDFSTGSTAASFD